MSDYNGPNNSREKLERALRQKAILAERSKLLQQQVEDFRNRETSMNHIASELLQRQRELNYMLHRASSVLHQMQDTNLALSAEFTHLVKELPAPREGEESSASEWEETISRVNDLFRRTHELAGEMQDEIFRNAAESPLPDPNRDVAAVTVTAEPPVVEMPHEEPPIVELQHDEPLVIEMPQVEEPSEPLVAEAVETITEADPLPEPAAQVELIEPVQIEQLWKPEPAIETMPEPEPQMAGAVIIEQGPDPEPVEDTPQKETMEDIFRRLNAAESDSLQWRDDGTAAEPPRKPSLLSRIFGMADEE